MLSIKRLLIIGQLGLLATHACASAADLTDLALEDLMNIEITSASKYAQSAATAPSSVTVVTREDIRSFGWRTLADVMNAQRGFHVSYDRTYHFLGVRGFAPPGDLNNRILFLIDGQRINDNVYDSVMGGETFPLDLDLVERIEIVRGPGAVMYGGNALFGSINVVTRSGAALGGVEGSVTLVERDSRGARVSAGRNSNGLDWLVSVSGARSDGGRYEFPDVTPGIKSPAGADAEEWQRLFGKFTAGDWHGQLIYGKRQKHVPTAAYGTIPNDGAHREDDAYTLAELGRDFRFDNHNTLSARVFAGHYRYDSVLPYDYSADGGPPRMINRDIMEGQWQGVETRWQSTAWAGQRWVVGFEAQADNQMLLTNYDDDGTEYFRATPSSHRWGLYAQDEISLNATTSLTVGLRHDKTRDRSGHWSPRLALVHQYDPANTLKLMHGTAFRNPNPAEYAGTYANPKLETETIRNTEFAWESRLSPNTSLTSSLYQFRIQDIIYKDVNTSQQENGNSVDGRGAEFELTHRTADGWLLKGSYAAQSVQQDGSRPDNSPTGLLKLHASIPFAVAWRAGAEVLALTSRHTTSGAVTVPGHAVTNLNLSYRPAGSDWEASLLVRNLFDQRYDDPAPTDLWLKGITGLDRESFRQDGRLVGLKLTGWFR